MSNYLCSPGCAKGASSLSLPWKPSPSISSQPVSCWSAEAHISNGTGSLNLPISIASQPRCFSQRHSLSSERVSIRGSFNPLNLSKPSTSQVAHFNNGIFKSLCKSPAPLSNKGVGFKSHTGKIWYRSSDSSRRDSNSGRGKSLERSHSKREQKENVPSSQKKFGRSSSFNLFVDRTKDAVMWSSKRSRSTSGERQQRHSPTSDKQYEVERSSVASAILTEAPPAPSPVWQLSLPHVAVATLSSVLFGYHIGVVNVPLQYIAKDLGFAGNALVQGFVVSICLVGAFLGCAISGSVADLYGRRRAFQLSTVPMICGAIISAIAPSVGAMLIGRFLVGAGLGLSGPVTALYVSEISPNSVRGTYGSLLQIATCVGILAALVAGLPAATVPGWWRVCFWLSTIPAAMLALGMEFCAESPRWLFKQRKLYRAKNEYARLWGPAHVKNAMIDLARGEQKDKGGASWQALIDPRYIRVVMIGAVLFAFQQFAGINAIFYFSSTVFKSAGVTSEVGASVAVGIVNLLASCLACYLMDKLGRRSLMIYSFTGMGLAMAMQAAAASISALAAVQGTTALVGTLIYVFMFALGAGPVPALILPELFADRIRAKALSVAMCVHWVANFSVGLTFLYLLKRLGSGTLYAGFAAVCLVAALFVRRYVLETKGRSLEEIEALLMANI